MSVRIENATGADLDAIAALLHALFTQESEFTPDRDRQLRALRMLFDEPSAGRLFVARENDLVIGMASLQFEISTALGGRAAWVEDVIVDVAHRGRGVGTLLFEHLVVFARRKGLLRLSLLTDSDNVTAQRLYTRFGFARSSMLPMRLVLDV
jgi:ribosomal protein S18 acetylase RimI-like enzyme